MPHFRKGSPEAKAYMARLRAMRGKGCRGAGKRRCKGGSLLSILGKAYTSTLGKWIKGWRDEDVAQRKELKRLRGGKFDAKKDVVDILAGPLGWIKMGIRKKREKEIAKLRGEQGSGRMRGGSVNEDVDYLTRVLENPKMRALLQEKFKAVLRKQK